MAKIAFVADIHIKLGQKKVPKDWQRNRIMMLAAHLDELDVDYIVIGGDLLDVADPTMEELGLMYGFLDSIDTPKVLIPGNHEMETKKRDCFSHIEKILRSTKTSLITEFKTQDGIDYIPYNILHNKSWPEPQSRFAVTHVRGEIPPHVKPEIDLDRLKVYEKVFTGDLHSHTNSQGNLHYPGSPFTTSFHRVESTGSNGYFIINTDTGDHIWYELFLPQLIRRTVSQPEDMVETPYHHTIYELEGDIDDLGKVENSDLLDKKVKKNISKGATLDLNGNLEDELAVFLKEVQGLPEETVSRLISRFKDTQ